MTRDEAKKYYLENDVFLYGYSDDVNDDIEGTVECVINGIYDSLNRRKCSNCKKQNTFMCPVTSFDANIEDFSCNRWESK